MLLNDEIDDFSFNTKDMNAFGLRGSAANLLAPGKRPVSSMTPDAILAITQNRTPSASGKQQLERIAAQKKLVAEADRSIRGAEQRIQSLSTDQDRLRQNISSLNSIAGQGDVVQKYARDLAAREQQIVTLRDQAAEQRTKKSALESELNAMLEKLEF